MATNKVIFGSTTVMDISDTTADESKVLAGEVFYNFLGERKVGTMDRCPFPVNGIYMSMNAADPSTIWAGTTWSRVAEGKTLFGVSTSDTDFGASSVGGSKTLQEHTHGFTDAAYDVSISEDGEHHHQISTTQDAGAGTAKNHYTVSGGTLRNTSDAGLHSHTATASVATSGAVNNVSGLPTGQTAQANNNLPPYMTCYMWKRTA